MGQVTDTSLREHLIGEFRWLGDSTDDARIADPTGWWRNPKLISELGGVLADLFEDTFPTVVLGLQSRGLLLGALVARHLGVGLVEARKNPTPAADSDAWVTCMIRPDYQDRQFVLGLRRDLLRSGDRVLLVDDWVQTGSQAMASKELVEACGASWLGAAVVVDGLEDSRTRRDLVVRSLVHVRELDRI